MKNISVIGAGTMGNGIAHVFAQKGFMVTLIDVSTPQLEKALATIAKNLDRQGERCTSRIKRRRKFKRGSRTTLVLCGRRSGRSTRRSRSRPLRLARYQHRSVLALLRPSPAQRPLRGRLVHPRCRSVHQYLLHRHRTCLRSRRNRYSHCLR